MAGLSDVIVSWVQRLFSVLDSYIGLQMALSVVEKAKKLTEVN